MKIQHYVKSMCASRMFDDKKMHAWEIKPPAGKTWDAANTHFFAIYKSKKSLTPIARDTPVAMKVLAAFLAVVAHPTIYHESYPTFLQQSTTACQLQNNAQLSSTPTACMTSSKHAAAIMLDNSTLLKNTRINRGQCLTNKPNSLHY